MFNKPLIKKSSKQGLNIKELSEIVIDLDECNEELFSGGNLSPTGNITLTATSDTTSMAIALPSLIGQVNKAKQ
ncbi:MAG: hypothetical protein ICV78_01310 [Tolypothrix sp. Co-bin9]|nr:hypothetical protein [Tolypothrix sp. Co-bin9]